jgi:hypothetical protein
MKSMRSFAVAVSTALLAAACSSTPPAPGSDGGTDNHSDGGPQPNGPSFDIAVLDDNAPGRMWLSLASSGSKIGVAYYVETGSTPPFELRYVEQGGTPESLGQVTRAFGVSLVYDASGNPVIGYLGGTSQTQAGWQQSDLAIATKSGGSWQTSIAATLSGDCASGQTFNDTGDVVGLYPALVVRPNGNIFAAYRDVHYAQFPTDWAKSDLETVEGAFGSWTRNQCMVALGGPFQGAGGLNSAVLGPSDQPAVAWSSFPASAGEPGTPIDVYFSTRASGTWSNPIKVHTSAGTDSGPSLAYDSRVGYAVAYEDRGQGVTYYQESSDGKTWRTAQPMYTTATGGWYPSLAFTPDGEPAIAWYDCSLSPGSTTCPASEDALVLSIRQAGMWPSTPITVDPDGAYWPRLAYVNGKAVVAYKDAAAKKLKLAVEK